MLSVINIRCRLLVLGAPSAIRPHSRSYMDAPVDVTMITTLLSSLTEFAAKYRFSLVHSTIYHSCGFFQNTFGTTALLENTVVKLTQLIASRKSDCLTVCILRQLHVSVHYYLVLVQYAEYACVLVWCAQWHHS